MSSDKIFVDTGALYSAVTKRDLDHKKCAEYFQSSEDIFITTDYVFDELMTLLRIKNSHETAVEVGEKIRKGMIQLLELSSEEKELAWSYFKKHRDKEYSFTNCTSFCTMKNLGIHKAFSLDKNFTQAGFSLVP